MHRSGTEDTTESASISPIAPDAVGASIEPDPSSAPSGEHDAWRARPADLSRRRLLAGAAALGGAALTGAGTGSARATSAASATKGKAATKKARPAPPAIDPRLERAYEVRLKAAQMARDLSAPAPLANGDEARLPGRIACYSKALPHDKLGRVDAKAYDVLLRALASGKPEDFERIPLGGFVKLSNPQSAWSYELLGPDGCQLACPPAPAFDGAEQAAEMVELYWHALARDVHFSDYGTHETIARACADLSRLSDFRGPKREGKVVPETLFRGATQGDLVGPYVSQFLVKPIPYLPMRVEQKIRTAVPALDYMTVWEDWLAVQNGQIPGVNRFDEAPRYLRNGRDLGEYVHRDFTFQAFLGACLIALRAGTQPDGGNPYKHSRTQSAFTTFGPPYLIYLLAVVSQAVLKVCWYQKWRVHRRVRPEEHAGRVEAHRKGIDPAPFHADLLGSGALEETQRRFGSALLPQAYPEASPTHPSYPAGHAVIAGACVTALKACFDESHVLPEPVVASADGLALVPWKGADLTVGNELDKLASNIAIGRDFAGLHWRTDAVAGIQLGEEVAIEILKEQSLTGNELFAGWSLRKLDGQRITIG